MKNIFSTAAILFLVFCCDISACDQDDVFNKAPYENNIQNKDNIIFQDLQKNEIIWCIYKDDADKLQGYIRDNVDMNLTYGERNNNTPLHTALEWKSIKCAALLIDHLLEINKSLNIKNRLNQTPLHLAFKLDDETCADKLFPHYIEQGVPLNEPDAFGRTFLHNTIIHGHIQASLALMDNIIKNKDTINLKDIYCGHTPLRKAVHYACKKRARDYYAGNKKTREYDDIIRKILFYDASSLMIDDSLPNIPDPNNPNPKLYTPLDSALFCGETYLVDLLVDNAPRNVLQNWKSATVKGADLMLVLETLGLSDAKIKDDEQQRKTIRKEFSRSSYKYRNDSESHKNIMEKLSHKCGTDRYAEV